MIVQKNLVHIAYVANKGSDQLALQCCLAGANLIPTHKMMAIDEAIRV